MSSIWRSAPARLRGVYGAIVSAARSGLSAFSIQREISTTIPEATAQQLGQIISRDNALANAIDRINIAKSTDAVTADMIGVAQWAPDGTTAGSPGMYGIRVPYANPGSEPGTIDGWVSTHVTTLPATVGDLLDFAQQTLDSSETGVKGKTVSPGINILNFGK